MNTRRAADHVDDGTFNDTGGRIVSERLRSCVMLTNLRDKQGICKIRRRLLRLRNLKVQT